MKEILTGKSIFRSLLKCLKKAIFMITDTIACFPCRRKKVALIVRLDAIGDFFLWLQSGALEISRFAGSENRKVVLLANQRWAEYAKTLGLWDEVIAIDPDRFIRSLWYRLKWGFRIRRLGASLFIQPRAARVLLQDDAIARVSGATRKVGPKGVLVNSSALEQRIGNLFYHELIEVPSEHSVHEIRRNERFCMGLTGMTPGAVQLPEHTVKSNTGRMVIALGAGWAGRVWPIGKLQQFLDISLNRSRVLEVILLGTQADKIVAKQLCERFGDVIYDLTGTTTLSDYVSEIASAEVVICNESSAYHIAVALRRKVICFLGGGHYGWFAPYPSSSYIDSCTRGLSVQMDCFWCNWICRYKRAVLDPVRCVASISVDSAVGALDSVLG